MIETQRLTMKYGDLVAVDSLDLAVAEGEIFGFVGPNGAGKTTTIQILATLLKPTSGIACIDGLNVQYVGREVRRIVGYMPDTFGVYENLTVAEYLEFFAAVYGVPRRERARVLNEVLELTDLGGKNDTMVSALSRGMQQRLGLARVLVHDPRVLLLDEPASGLDPRARVEVREILKELRAMGKTVLLSSHILSELAEICTSVGIIERGKLVASGPLEDLLARAGVGNVVRVRLDRPADGAVEALRQLEGVERVEENSDGEFRVLLSDGTIGAPEVTALLVQHGARVRNVDAETVDLEEAYMRLTAGLVS